jgi:hypothetical protein
MGETMSSEQRTARETLDALKTWAIAECDDWRHKNADRYWQMSRVVEHINTALASLRAAPAPPDVIEDLVVALRSLGYRRAPEIRQVACGPRADTRESDSRCVVDWS